MMLCYTLAVLSLYKGSDILAINDYTRKHFAEVLQEMLLQKDLENIRVNDLCVRSGTQRGTFYYYFKDKYDLVSWVFLQDLEYSNLNSGKPYTVHQLAQSLERMWDKRDFYLKAFNDHSQNTLFEYIQEYDVKFLENIVKQHLGTSELTEEQRFQIKYNSYGCLGYTIEWLKGKIPVTGSELAEFEFRVMPKMIIDAYNGIGKESLMRPFLQDASGNVFEIGTRLQYDADTGSEIHRTVE